MLNSLKLPMEDTVKATIEILIELLIELASETKLV